jgi:hypothetical protein
MEIHVSRDAQEYVPDELVEDEDEVLPYNVMNATEEEVMPLLKMLQEYDRLSETTDTRGREELGKCISSVSETVFAAYLIVNPEKNPDMFSGFTYSSQGSNILFISL